MRATLVTPITSKARQQTMMKYGLRIENRGIRFTSPESMPQPDVEGRLAVPSDSNDAELR